MGAHGLFLGGVPTGPDVRRLLAAFPNLKAGDEVAHGDIANVIGVDAKSTRYRVVTDAWRRHLLKVGNLKTVAVAGVGFRLIDGMERLVVDVKDYASGVKKIRKSSDDVRRIEVQKLPQSDQSRVEHVLRHMDASENYLRKASKEIAIEFKPQEQLPRVRAVK